MWLHRHRKLLVSAIVLFAALSSGCGSEGKKIVRVTGTVTRNGQPFPNVALSFTPTTGRPSWGLANASGHFKLLYTIDKDGAEVGTHTVTIEFPPANPQEEADLASGKKKPSADRSEILKKYGDRNKPALTVEVEANGKPIEVRLD